MPNSKRIRFKSIQHKGLKIGGKWDADLNVSDSEPVAELTITISIYFNKIDYDGEILDGDKKVKRVISWKRGEFEQFKTTLLFSAQRFWDKFFWLKTPSHYNGLDWPDSYPHDYPSHRCNVCCRLMLIEASEADAHYVIYVVRLADDESEMPQDSLHFSNRIIEPTHVGKHIWQWPHYHEVGHLLGLGHVNQRNMMAKKVNITQAYGVTKAQIEDVMGAGSVKNKWHAAPWQEAAAMITGTKKQDWGVSIGRLNPVVLDAMRAMTNVTKLPGLPGLPRGPVL